MTPNRLYHYTTPEGLIGIIRTKTLWATEIFYLNDSRELIHGIELALESLRTLRSAADEPVQKERTDFLLHQLRDYGKAFHTNPVYVSSLTTQPDQLSQWRAYCRGGGFAIGFPVDQLRSCLQEQHFALHECVYDDNAQSELMTSVVDDIARPWIESAQVPLDEDRETFKASGELAWQLARTASRLKHSSFAEECEFRLISQPERPYDAASVEFRCRGGLIIPYTSIRLPDTSDFWGRAEIVIGPTRMPEASRASVYAMVRRYHGRILGMRLSSTPYREL